MIGDENLPPAVLNITAGNKSFSWRCMRRELSTRR
jgi:hypothetical protein